MRVVPTCVSGKNTATLGEDQRRRAPLTRDLPQGKSGLRRLAPGVVNEKMHNTKGCGTYRERTDSPLAGLIRGTTPEVPLNFQASGGVESRHATRALERTAEPSKDGSGNLLARPTRAICAQEPLSRISALPARLFTLSAWRNAKTLNVTGRYQLKCGVGVAISRLQNETMLDAGSNPAALTTSPLVGFSRPAFRDARRWNPRPESRMEIYSERRKQWRRYANQSGLSRAKHRGWSEPTALRLPVFPGDSRSARHSNRPAVHRAGAFEHRGPVLTAPGSV